MNDAVLEYKARRKARLDAKAVEEFRKRRNSRLAYRLDDEENENNGGESGGHGNVRIPYGLCQREGITIEAGWTPRDAWNALAEKGYSADKVYKELKTTGKVGKPKKSVIKLTEEHFPSFMRTKALKKTVTRMADLISKRCDDGNITDLISAAAVGGGKVPGIVRCKRSTRDGSAAVVAKHDPKTKIPLSCDITIPMIGDKTNEAETEQKIRDFCHEWTHYLDLTGRSEDKYGHFSGTIESLHEAVQNDDGSIGDEVKKIFSDFRKRSDEMNAERAKRLKDFPKEVATEIYGDNWPEWINKMYGYVDELKAWSKGAGREAHKYNLELKKRQKEIFSEFAERKRRMMNGVSNLQGLYDAIYGGKDKKERDIVYGHSEGYFARGSDSRVTEALAEYVALKATNPKLAAVFAKDKPDIARELDSAIVGLASRLRGGK